MKRLYLLCEQGPDREPRPVARYRRATYMRATQSVTILYQVELDRALIEIVRLNYKDIEAQAMLLANNSINAPYMEALASRVFLNFLSSTRLYIDQMQRRIVQRYGTSSKEAGRFRAALAREYDRSFSYRFMSRMRNYVQHRGLPFTALRSECIVGGSTTEPPKFTTRLYCHPRRLLREFDGWGPLKAELARRRRPIDLFYHARLMKRALEKLDELAILLAVPRVITAYRYLVALIGPGWHQRSLLFIDTGPAARSLRRKVNADGVRLAMIPLPQHIMKQVRRWKLPNPRMQPTNAT